MRNGTGTSTALRQPQVFIAPGLGRFAHDSVRRVRREIPRFCSMIVKEASVNLAAAARTMADSHGAMPLRTLQTIDGLGASASNTAVIAVPVELTDVRAKLDNSAALSPTSIAEPGPRRLTFFDPSREAVGKSLRITGGQAARGGARPGPRDIALPPCHRSASPRDAPEQVDTYAVGGCLAAGSRSPAIFVPNVPREKRYYA